MVSITISAMIKYLLAAICVLFCHVLSSQDLIVTISNDSIKGDITYETPGYYQINDISGLMRSKYGDNAKIYRQDIASVSDAGDMASLKRFGNLKLKPIDGTSINAPFYSRSDSSIMYVSDIYTSTGYRNQYASREIPAATIGTLRWKDNDPTPVVIGALVGGVVGAGIGALAGKTAEATVSLVTLGTEEVNRNPIAPILGGVIGASIGGAIGSAQNNKIGISVNGSLEYWQANMHKLPPAGFRK